MDHAAYDEMRALEDDHWWFKSRRRAIAPLIAGAVEPSSASRNEVRLLEVGCGTGGNLAFVRASFPDLWSIGLDVERRALAHCRGRDLPARLVCGDGIRLPFADASVDCILALDVIEHFEDDRALLAEFERVLAPAGQVVASVPRHPTLWSPHDDFLHHKRRYVTGELEGKLAQAGFEIGARCGFSLFLLPPIALVRWARRGVQKALGAERTGGTDFFALPRPVSLILEGIYAVERAQQRLVPLPWGISLMIRAQKRPGKAGSGK